MCKNQFCRRTSDDMWLMGGKSTFNKTFFLCDAVCPKFNCKQIKEVKQFRLSEIQNPVLSVHNRAGVYSKVKGRKDGNVLFNDTLNTFFILRLYGIRHNYCKGPLR